MASRGPEKAVTFDISRWIEEEQDLRNRVETYWETVFRKSRYGQLASKQVRIFRVRTLEDLENLSTVGFYLIATDYESKENPCECIIDEGAKVIYRGQGSRMKPRIQSHIFNREHLDNKKGPVYTACLKLDGRNGINIDDQPYCQFAWYVIEHKMPGSTNLIREQAEIAFDAVFGKPLGCKDKLGKRYKVHNS